MVSQFYIESREHALRASEEKYRNTIDHAPDPMYEIEPRHLDRAGRQLAAAEACISSLPDDAGHAADGPPVDRAWTARGCCRRYPEHVETVVREGSDQTRDLPEAGRYFDVNSALITFGKRAVRADDPARRDPAARDARRAAEGRAPGRGRHLRRRRRARGEQSAGVDLVAGAVAAAGRDRPRRGAPRCTRSCRRSRASRRTLKDLVNFARPSTAQRKPFDLNDQVAETLRLVTYNKRFSGITRRTGTGPRSEARVRRQQRDPAGAAQSALQRRRRDASTRAASSGSSPRTSAAATGDGTRDGS